MFPSTQQYSHLKSMFTSVRPEIILKLSRRNFTIWRTILVNYEETSLSNHCAHWWNLVIMDFAVASGYRNRSSWLGANRMHPFNFARSWTIPWRGRTSSLWFGIRKCVRAYNNFLKLYRVIRFLCFAQHCANLILDRVNSISEYRTGGQTITATFD